jgi:type IV pilus assembly protein PilE
MKDRSAGFTLLELMIALAIVAIIAAFAYPSYMGQLRQSRRAEATVALETLAQGQERFYARFRMYTSVIVAPNPCAGAACGLGLASNVTANGFYSVAANGNAATFSLTATAVGRQLADTVCRTLAVDSIGARTATNYAGDDATADCWR